LARQLEQRLSQRLASFFEERARELAPTIAARLGKLAKQEPNAEDEDETEPASAEQRQRHHFALETALGILAVINLGNWSQLRAGVAEDLSDAYESGIGTGLKGAGFDKPETTINEARAAAGLAPLEAGGDVPPAIAALARRRATEWAQQHAGGLITGIEERTRGMLQTTVAQAIEQDWSADELAEALIDSPGFSLFRALTIARTEIGDAQRKGSVEAFRESKVVEMKIFVTMGDDLVEEDCQENADAGPIPLDEDFPNGDTPHPNCRCSIEPAFEEAA
jgi:Phage Mu protein F like protein